MWEITLGGRCRNHKLLLNCDDQMSPVPWPLVPMTRRHLEVRSFKEVTKLYANYLLAHTHE